MAAVGLKQRLGTTRKHKQNLAEPGVKRWLPALCRFPETVRHFVFLQNIACLCSAGDEAVYSANMKKLWQNPVYLRGMKISMFSAQRKSLRLNKNQTDLFLSLKPNISKIFFDTWKYLFYSFLMDVAEEMSGWWCIQSMSCYVKLTI